MAYSKKKVKTQLEGIAGLLGHFLSRNPDYKRKIAQYSLFAVWDRVVGERISKHAQPVRMQDRVLIVRVSNSSWMQELRVLKPQLLRQIHDHVAADLICDIRLEVGPLAR